MRKGAAHLERSHAAEGNLTGLEYLDVVHVNLRFSSRCVVLADGAAGDVIRVMNLESRATISAVVQPDGSLLALK